MKNILIMFIMAVIMSTGCKSTVKRLESTNQYMIKKERVLQSKRSETRVKIYEQNGKLSFKWVSPLVYWAALQGDVKETGKGYQLNINQLNILTNWPNGWTYGVYDASGTIELDSTGDCWTAGTMEDIEVWELIKGEMKYFDDYYLNENGLDKVKNRMYRIRAYNKYLRTKTDQEYFGHRGRESQYGTSYKAVFKSVFLNRNVPVPEEFLELKKSGTIYRDFEEALGLMYMDYNMDYYFKNKINGVEFSEK